MNHLGWHPERGAQHLHALALTHIGAQSKVDQLNVAVD